MKLLPFEDSGSHPQSVTQPWDRQPGESENAFAAFDAYRLMGSDRSLTKLGGRLGKTRQMIEDWSWRHSWTMRTLAWDQHEAWQLNQLLLSGTAKMREPDLAIARTFEGPTSLRLSAMGLDSFASNNDSAGTCTEGVATASTPERPLLLHYQAS